jgi:hypothetical protein
MWRVSIPCRWHGAGVIIDEAGGGVSSGREIGRKKIKFCPV